MRHQKFHLVGEYAAIPQNKVFPQTGHIRRVKQGHIGLLGRTAALSMVAASTGGNHIHPGIDTFLREGNDVFSGKFLLMKTVATISAHIAIPNKQLAVGQAWFG